LRITVKYTLPFRDETGVKEETYETDQDAITVAGVLDMIVRRHSSIGKFVDAASDEAQRRQLVIAINSRLARLSDQVHDGDNVSLLLPVMGGSEER
jgi:molybdopterin converting factor small subunit